MSASIGWRPLATKLHDLPDELKFALRQGGFGETRGFGSESVGFFLGLKAAKVDGAQEVLDALEKHESIVIEWSY